MTFGSLFVLALGLAMDATAVSAARGLAVPRIRLRHVAIVALSFGGFQALMPLGGWLLGKEAGSVIDAWDHWVAFVLLGALGAKMLWEARKAPGEDGARIGEAETEAQAHAEAEAQGEAELFGLKVMLALGVATSLDAFAAGFTLPMLDAPLLASLAIIGVTTAVLSAAGLFAGRRFGAALGQRLDAVGGLVLIGLGTKILVSHLSGG